MLGPLVDAYHASMLDAMEPFFEETVHGAGGAIFLKGEEARVLLVEVERSYW